MVRSEVVLSVPFIKSCKRGIVELSGRRVGVCVFVHMCICAPLLPAGRFISLSE